MSCGVDLLVKHISLHSDVGISIQLMSANKKFPLGDLSIQQNDKTLVSSVASTSKEPSQNLKDSDTKLVSEEKGSGHVAVHHVDGEFLKLSSAILSLRSICCCVAIC